MRTTINIDDELLAEAERRVGARTKTALIELALQALIRECAHERLIRAGGTMPDLRLTERRRPA